MKSKVQDQLNQVITNAYQEGNIDAMKTLLEWAIDIACQEGNVEATMQLLDQAIKIAYQDDNIAAIIQLLDRASNNSNVQFEVGSTYLVQAVFWDSLEAVELLLDQAIKIAYQAGNVADIKQLLDQVNNFNIQGGDTYLHKAAFWNNAEAVELLVQNGEEVNNIQYRPALHVAASLNNTKVINKLLDMGADINIQYNMGWTALHVAIFKANTTTVELLLANGADINIPLDNGFTALAWVTGDNYPTHDDDLNAIKRLVETAKFADDIYNWTSGSDLPGRPEVIDQKLVQDRIIKIISTNQPDPSQSILDNGSFIEQQLITAVIEEYKTEIEPNGDNTAYTEDA